MFHEFAIPQTNTPTAVMTPSHPRWQEFIDQLRNHRARCQHELLLSIDMLAAMGGIDVIRSLTYFQECGVRCDCELATRLGSATRTANTAGAASVPQTRSCLQRQCPEVILGTLTAQLHQLRRAAEDPSAMVGADVTNGVYPDRDGEDTELSRTQRDLQDAIREVTAVAAQQRARARTAAAANPGTVMNPCHPRWAEFIAQLQGPAGLAEAECQDDYRFSERILGRMGGINLPASLAFFEAHGGCCDCEVLINMAEPIVAWPTPIEADGPVGATNLSERE